METDARLPVLWRTGTPVLESPQSVTKFVEMESLPQARPVMMATPLMGTAAPLGVLFSQDTLVLENPQSVTKFVEME